MMTFIPALKYLLIVVSFIYTINASGNNNTCSCYMLGTFGSIDGESLCDNKTLQCKCYRNVIGKNCDKCAEGFYGILGGHGCSKCHCSSLGSNGESCDAFTGQCSCKPGFTGSRCDLCEPFTYKFTKKECLKCNCDPYGSKDIQCDLMGQCPCLPNVEGTHCDQCKENMYNIKEGCVPCPPCYDFVQGASKNYFQNLTQIEQVLKNIENNLPTHIQNYKHFLNEIKLLKAKIAKLKMQYEDADEAILHEEKLQTLMKDADDFYKEVVDLSQKLKNELPYEETKNSLYVSQTDLKDANDLVTLCEDALQTAIQISNNLNRHNQTMTEIAKDALVATQDIENKVKELENLAANVNSSCREACNVAETFSQSQQAFEDELQSIGKEIQNTVNGVDIMKTYLEAFKEKTKVSKEEARRLTEEANLLVIPDPEKISSELDEINNNLKLITVKLKLYTENSDTMKERQTHAEDILNQVQIKQKSINDDFLLVQKLEGRADEAVDKSNNILKTAQESLGRIKEYKKIQEAAEEALKSMPEIRDKVDAVLNQSEEIQVIFQELLAVVNDLEKLKVKLSDIFKTNDEKSLESEQNLKLLEELEKEESEISTKLPMYHAKIKGVRNNLEDLQKSQDDIETIIKKFLEYIIVVDSFPTSEKELGEVEEEILKMEEMVDTIEYLEQEKKRLQEEVENIKEIIESIPEEDSSLCESAKSEPKESL